MKHILKTSLTLIFFMLAGAASAGECLRLCDYNFWESRPSLDKVKAEIAKGADLSKGNSWGETALHFSVGYGDPEHTSFLIQQGANIDAKTRRDSGLGKRTPLHFAVYHNDLETASVLLQAGANVNAKAQRGITPLFMAVKKINGSMIDLLLDFGANARQRDIFGNIAIDQNRGSPEWIKHLSTYRRLKAASGE